MKYAPVATLIAFAATAPVANWLISNVGTECVPNGPCIVPIGFGLMAPSGVLLIGLALVLRDLIHECYGKTVAAVAVVLGAVASYATSSPQLAVASAAAYFVAEFFDFAVYARIRRTNIAIAVAASGLLGAAIDSALFVYLAFGSLDFSAGNFVGKAYASFAVAAYLAIRARSVRA